MKRNTKSTAESFAEYGALAYTNPKMPIVYGPMESRRLGTVLGINLLGEGQKVCSFDCPYCDLGPTTLRLNKLKTGAQFPSLADLESALKENLQTAHQSSQKINALVLSGNGEPTLHPLFPEAVDLILKARSLYMPGTPVSVLTNGANLETRKIVEALNKLDSRMVKVDAGNERVFKFMNSPLVRSSITKVISGIHNLNDVTIQSFFIQGIVDNTQAADIEDWIEVIGLIKPKAVHIHGMSRVPAARGLIAPDEDTLYSIASKLERRTQIRSLVFP